MEDRQTERVIERQSKRQTDQPERQTKTIKKKRQTNRKPG